MSYIYNWQWWPRCTVPFNCLCAASLRAPNSNERIKEYYNFKTPSVLISSPNLTPSWQMGYTTQNALALWCECQYIWKQWWNKTDV